MKQKYFSLSFFGILFSSVILFTCAQKLTFPSSSSSDSRISFSFKRQTSSNPPSSPPPPPFPVNHNPIYDFATNLYLKIKEEKQNDENILVSPFSIRVISALIYMASRGQTAEEIRRALQFPESHDALVEGLQKHLSSTQFVQKSKFDIGNGIFVREAVRLNDSFAHILQDQLRSQIVKTPFRDPTRAAASINQWVANVTRNRIKKIVDQSTLSKFTSIFLANALYFSGQWATPFDDKVTSPGTFHLENGQNITVPVMQIETKYSYNYVEELKSTGISLPFKDSRFEFIMLKPQDEVRLEEVEALLEGYQLDRLSKKIKAENRSVFLKMPKFRLDVHYDMVQIMENLGIKALFDQNKADLSGLTRSGGANVVSNMIHETALDINENGATAAAVSAVSIYPISSPSYFSLDRPFIFLLNDRLTGPVFFGRVTNPNPQHSKQ